MSVTKIYLHFPYLSTRLYTPLEEKEGVYILLRGLIAYAVSHNRLASWNEAIDGRARVREISRRGRV